MVTLTAADPNINRDLVDRIARRSGVTPAAVIAVLQATLEEVPPDA